MEQVVNNEITEGMKIIHNLKKGFLVVPRAILTSEVWLTSSCEKRYWIVDLLMKAGWHNSIYKYNGNDYFVPLGSVIYSERGLAKEYKTTRKAIQCFIHKLKRLGFIEVQKQHRQTRYPFSMLTLCKYSTYQNINSYLPSQKAPLGHRIKDSKTVINLSNKTIYNNTLKQTFEPIDKRRFRHESPTAIRDIVDARFNR